MNQKDVLVVIFILSKGHAMEARDGDVYDEQKGKANA